MSVKLAETISYAQIIRGINDLVSNGRMSARDSRLAACSVRT